MLEVEDFTNWKKRFMCHIIGIEPLFKSIIQDGPYVPITAGNRKPESQWSANERKFANLDQRLKSLIMSDSQDSPDDEEDTRSSQEYMNDLEEEFHERALLVNSKRRKCHFARDFFSKTSVPSYSSPSQNNTQPKVFSSSQQKPKLRPTKDFEAKYNKVKAKLALLSSGASTSKSSMVKNKGLVHMALADDENVVVGKESARIENGIPVIPVVPAEVPIFAPLMRGLVQPGIHCLVAPDYMFSPFISSDDSEA
ncbi:hypothetical protein Tco_0849692 [Tanacetum coccineum]